MTFEEIKEKSIDELREELAVAFEAMKKAQDYHLAILIELTKREFAAKDSIEFD